MRLAGSHVVEPTSRHSDRSTLGLHSNWLWRSDDPDDRGSRPAEALRERRVLSTASTWSPRAGRWWRFSGSNGAGKTTFVRAVATLLRLDGGTLRVAGHDVRREPAAVRREIGLAGQFAAIEPAMTGRENLGDGRAAVRTGAAERQAQRRFRARAARLLDAGASTGSAPTPVGCAAVSTSARASLARRGCSLLDEPTTGLDPRSRIELWNAIRKRLSAREPDVLLTTQYLDEADHPRQRGRDHRTAAVPWRWALRPSLQTPDRRQRDRVARHAPRRPRKGSRRARAPRPARGADRRADTSRQRPRRIGSTSGSSQRCKPCTTTGSRSTISRCASPPSTRSSSPSPDRRSGTPNCKHQRRRGLTDTKATDMPGITPTADRASTRIAYERGDRRASRRAAIRAHAAADRARDDPDDALLPDLPLHVRRRRPPGGDSLRRLLVPGLPSPPACCSAGIGTAVAETMAEDLEQGSSTGCARSRYRAVRPSSQHALSRRGHRAILTYSLAATTAIGFAVGFRLHGSALDRHRRVRARGIAFGFAFVWPGISSPWACSPGNAQRAAQGMGMIVFPFAFIS